MPMRGAATVLTPREVPLGGPRAMLVRRTLPHRERRMIGAWCFVDHYGPVDLGTVPGMSVPPHPHTGLQTVSWLIDGLIEHRDSLGSHVLVRPEELALMTAGSGIAHSEDSLRQTPTLHGIQLWVALPDAARGQAPHFDHHADLPRAAEGAAEIVVFLGDWLGCRSPAATYSPLVGAQIRLRAGTEAELPLRPEFEHGVLAVDGEVDVDGQPVPEHSLAYLSDGHTSLRLRSSEGALVLLLGGEPFAEQIVMWWNFIGRSHEEVEQMRSMWQARQLTSEVHHPDPRLEAPPMPHIRLRARGALPSRAVAIRPS